jgi:hypothetical protein
VLQALDGSVVAVVSIAVDRSPRQVYNCEVADAHNYYVGWCAEPGFVLVHNACFEPFNENQRALADIVNENTANCTKPLSSEDAHTVMDWADELNLTERGAHASESDVTGAHWERPHIHVPGSAKPHVPISGW